MQQKHSLRICLMVVAAAMCPAGRAASAQQPAPVVRMDTKSMRVVHVRVVGDLDCVQVAADIAAARRKAAMDGAGMWILELGGRKWREDVVRDVIRAVRMPAEDSQEGPRCVVLLKDEEGRVGTGQAAVAAAASAAYMGMKGKIVYVPGDNSGDLVSPETDRESVERETQGMLHVSLRERGKSTMLCAMLPLPRQALWARIEDGADRGGKGAEVVAMRPVEVVGEGRTVELVELKTVGEAGRVSIPAEVALQVGIATGFADEVGEILAAERVRSAPLDRVSVASGLEDARKRLTKAHRGIVDIREKADADLDRAGKMKDMDEQIKKRDIASGALTRLEVASRELARIEELTAKFPELLRAAPPGRTMVGQDMDRLPTVWRAYFQGERDGLEDLKGRARQLAMTGGK